MVTNLYRGRQRLRLRDDGVHFTENKGLYENLIERKGGMAGALRQNEIFVRTDQSETRSTFIKTDFID